MPTETVVKETITLAEACEILRISYSWGCHVYHMWKDYGVRILRRVPGAKPRFYSGDIYRMMEKSK